MRSIESHPFQKILVEGPSSSGKHLYLVSRLRPDIQRYLISGMLGKSGQFVCQAKRSAVWVAGCFNQRYHFVFNPFPAKRLGSALGIERKAVQFFKQLPVNASAPGYKAVFVIFHAYLPGIVVKHIVHWRNIVGYTCRFPVQGAF